MFIWFKRAFEYRPKYIRKRAQFFLWISVDLFFGLTISGSPVTSGAKKWRAEAISNAGFRTSFQTSPTFFAVYDANPPFQKWGQRESHRGTINLRRELGTAFAAANNAQFRECLYDVLKKWGIGQRGSRLKSYEAFGEAIESHAVDIEQLDDLKIDDPQLTIHEVANRVWFLIRSLGIVENKATMVAGTKALHHLLPELVIPVDRIYTRTFFALHTPEFQGQYVDQGKVFKAMFTTFARIARAVPVASYVGKHPWRTSRTKVIDNAIVGFCLLRGLPLPS